MKVASRLASLQRERSGQLKESYYFTRLSNGLPVAFVPKKGLAKKSAMISTQYGAIDLKFRKDGNWVNSPAGVAHFLEHQLFKKQGFNIMQEFARLGAYYNAGTAYTATSYFFTATDNFLENLNLLCRLVFETYFSDEDVAKEKPIIEQELKMYLDMPDTRISRNLLENLYHAHPIRLEIGGTVESIKDITPKVLQECYRTFYHPNNMIAVFAGDLDRDVIIRQMENYFNPDTRPTKSSGRTKCRDSSHAGNGIERASIEEPVGIKNLKADIRMSISRPRILIGYKDDKVGLTGEKLISKSITTDIMLDCLLGKSSVFYNRLYNDGLIDDSFGFSYEIHPTYGMTIIGGETEKPDELYERILTGIKKAIKSRLKKRDIEIIKRRYLGRFVRLFDAPEHISVVFTYYHFNNLKIFETQRYIKRILVKDIRARLEECLDETRHAVSIIRPG